MRGCVRARDRVDLQLATLFILWCYSNSIIDCEGTYYGRIFDGYGKLNSYLTVFITINTQSLQSMLTFRHSKGTAVTSHRTIINICRQTSLPYFLFVSSSVAEAAIGVPCRTQVFMRLVHAHDPHILIQSLGWVSVSVGVRVSVSEWVLPRQYSCAWSDHRYSARDVDWRHHVCDGHDSHVMDTVLRACLCAQTHACMCMLGKHLCLNKPVLRSVSLAIRCERWCKIRLMTKNDSVGLYLSSMDAGGHWCAVSS